MKTRDIHFLIMVVVVVGFLFILSLTGRQRYLTRTPPHLSSASDMECFSCHDEGKQFPMTKEHPLRKKNCRQCHRLERGERAPPGRRGPLPSERTSPRRGGPPPAPAGA